jgi:DNA-binding XRE family transcriptional regulator
MTTAVKELQRREWLKDLRKEKGLTVRDLAKEIGVSWTHYSDIENGRKNPSLKLAVNMSKYFGFNVDKFVG